MSKQKKVVKKVVVSNKETGSSKSRTKPTVSKRGQKVETHEPLVFGRANYRLMLIGILVIAAGMLLMMGGSMPSPDVWDESLIYSGRRTVLAPFLIIAGFIIEVVAIFKTNN
jgi:hypothetical protein